MGPSGESGPGLAPDSGRVAPLRTVPACSLSGNAFLWIGNTPKTGSRSSITIFFYLIITIFIYGTRVSHSPLDLAPRFVSCATRTGAALTRALPSLKPPFLMVAAAAADSPAPHVVCTLFGERTRPAVKRWIARE